MPALDNPPVFHDVFFNPDLMEIDHWSIASVMDSWSAAWSQGSATVLVNAHKAYSDLLGDLGLEAGLVCAGLLKTRVERPLIFN